jgi:hypothetical protein
MASLAPAAKAPRRLATLDLFRGLGRYGVLLALVALILFGALRYENFLGAFNVLSVLRYNSMFALIALGMCFVIMTGGIDLSVGSTAALGSVVAALLSPYGLLPGLLGGVGAGLLVGLVNGLAVTRLHILPFIATLATMLAASGCALLLAGNQSVSVSTRAGIHELGQGDPSSASHPGLDRARRLPSSASGPEPDLLRPARAPRPRRPRGSDAADRGFPPSGVKTSSSLASGRPARACGVIWRRSSGRASPSRAWAGSCSPSRPWWWAARS